MPNLGLLDYSYGFSGVIFNFSSYEVIQFFSVMILGLLNFISNE